jgi:two-component system response regulator
MSAQRARAPVHVLLIEDDPNDARLTIRALERTRIGHHVHVATDGTQALAYLRRRGVHADAPRPDLILLDLRIPKIDGRALLGAIKHDAELQAIPVIVLSSATADTEVLHSYRLNANAFVAKPVDAQGLEKVLGWIERFWLETVRLP